MFSMPSVARATTWRPAIYASDAEPETVFLQSLCCTGGRIGKNKGFDQIEILQYVKPREVERSLSGRLNRK
jgi:hypothetical protein